VVGFKPTLGKWRHIVSTTLVLNADAQPVSVVPLSTVHWHDAIRSIYLERATVLEEYDRWVIRSPSVQVRMPSVIMLKQYQEHNGKVEFSRYNIILRDGYKCQYCGEQFNFDDLTFDHVIPRRDGGKTKWDNIVAACAPCNQQKAHHGHMKPRRAPYHPSYWELASNRKKRPITVPHEPWLQYICWGDDVIVDESLTKINVSEDEANNYHFDDLSNI
jgi:5-methylcytosine-specific restriction endonuclease McrA